MSKKFIDLRPTLKEFNNDPEIMALEKELAEREERVRFGRAFLKARKMVGVLPSETARQWAIRTGGPMRLLEGYLRLFMAREEREKKATRLFPDIQEGAS